MSARISRGLRIACAIGLAASLVGACSSPNEERDLPACDGTTYVLESAVRYQLIEGFSPPAAHGHRCRCCRRRATRHAHRELFRWSQRAGGHVSDPHGRGEHDPRQRRYLHSHRRAPTLRGEALVDTGGLLPAGPPAHRHCTYLRRRQRPPPPRRRARQPVLRVPITTQTVVETTPHQKWRPYPLHEAPLERIVSSC